MLYFKRNHRIDFNFFMDGDWVQLPGDVQSKLFPILQELHAETDQVESSDLTLPFSS